jgi:hypothetical protein
MLALSHVSIDPGTASRACAGRDAFDFYLYVFRCVCLDAASCYASRALPGDSSLIGANCTVRDRITLAAFTSAWSW